MLFEVLFWASLGAVMYSYALYPLLVALLVRLGAGKRPRSGDAYRPSVSIVIACFNEEKVLPEKLKNLSSTEYPEGSLEVVMGSDGSTDRTAEILNAWDFRNKKIHVCPDRRGKTHMLNDLLPLASGEIVVFSDANTLFEPTTVGRLVKWFADPEVGATCGELRLIPEHEDAGGRGEISYWQFENWLKKQESAYKTVLGATGGVYAIRRSLYAPLPTDRSMADDFITPLRIVRKGFRVVYAEDAVAYERTSGSLTGDFERKARIGAQNFAGIADFAQLLLPQAGFVAFALWSHKIIRWCVPFLAILFLLSSIALQGQSPFYTWVIAAEIAFVVVAGLGFFVSLKRKTYGQVGLPFYILAMNCALLVGFFRFLSRSQQGTWEIIR